MNDVCSGCGRPPHPGGCKLVATQPAPTGEETQRRADYLASDEFRRQRDASLAGLNPVKKESDSDLLNAVVVQRNDAREEARREKARADAAEAKCAQMQEGAAGLLDYLAAAEERGRRRGLEELLAIEPRLRSALHTMQGPVSDMEKRCHTDKPHNHNWMVALRFALKTLTEIHGEIAALAPRDSAPDPDPTCPEDFEPPWPRDSGPSIPSVASQGCHECSKPQPGDLGMGSIEARQLRCPHGKYKRDSGKEG